jgi:hypothetical protein
LESVVSDRIIQVVICNYCQVIIHFGAKQPPCRGCRRQDP